MFKTKIIISLSLFVTLMIITSAIKNKARFIEKQIVSLNIKILAKKEAVCIVLQSLFSFFVFFLILWQTRIKYQEDNNTLRKWHARARREAGDCRGVRAASPVRGLRGVHMYLGFLACAV